MRLLVFELAGTLYALELVHVREVLRAVYITPLPQAPAVIEGVIDLRGTVVPVYDLRARFGHAPKPLELSDELVVAWTGQRLVALRCDHTRTIEDAATVTPGAALRHAGRAVAGAASLPDGLVLIHDVRAFLDEAEEIALAAALQATTAGRTQ